MLGALPLFKRLAAAAAASEAVLAIEVTGCAGCGVGGDDEDLSLLAHELIRFTGGGAVTGTFATGPTEDVEGDDVNGGSDFSAAVVADADAAPTTGGGTADS